MQLTHVEEREDSYEQWLSSLKPGDEAFEQHYDLNGYWVYQKVIIRDVDTYFYPGNSNNPFNPKTGYCAYFNSDCIYANPLPYRLVPVSSVLTHKSIKVGQAIASTDGPVYWELWKHKTLYRVLKQGKPFIKSRALNTAMAEAYGYIEEIVGSDYDLLYIFCKEVIELELVYTTTHS